MQLQLESWVMQSTWRWRKQLSLRLLWHSLPLRQMQSDCPLQRRLLPLTCQKIREKWYAPTEKRERSRR